MTDDESFALGALIFMLTCIGLIFGLAVYFTIQGNKIQVVLLNDNIPKEAIEIWGESVYFTQIRRVLSTEWDNNRRQKVFVGWKKGKLELNYSDLYKSNTQCLGLFSHKLIRKKKRYYDYNYERWRTKRRSYHINKIYLKSYDPMVVAHEFGHFLGHEHSTNTNSIMYPFYSKGRVLSNCLEFKK